MKTRTTVAIGMLAGAIAIYAVGPTRPPAGAAWQFQNTGTKANLRGLSVVNENVVWASGSGGTYLRTTDAGKTWTAAKVTGAEELDFRGIKAFDAKTAVVMSSGPAEQGRARIYRTSNGGARWSLVYQTKTSGAFLDCMAFWDKQHGIVIGDPITSPPDRVIGSSGDRVIRTPRTQGVASRDRVIGSSGDRVIRTPRVQGYASTDRVIGSSGDRVIRTQQVQGYASETPILNNERLGGTPTSRFFVLVTDDGGRSWKELQGPAARKGDGVFAASNTEVAVQGKSDAWFVTGGAGMARVFRSTDRGRTWQAATTPVKADTASSGLFSVAFRDGLHGVAVGGDYRQPTASQTTVALTEDGGWTWTLAPAPAAGLFLSGVTWSGTRRVIAVGSNGWAESDDGGRSWTKDGDQGFNVVARSTGKMWAAGAEGRIAALSH